MKRGKGLVSKDFYLLDNPEYLDFKKSIMNEFEIYIRESLHIKKEYQFRMTTSWSVKYGNTDWGELHYHKNAIFSGVVYLKAPEKSGKIYFKKEIVNLFTRTFEPEFEDYNIYNSDWWHMQPEENMMLFFPSHLNHSIEMTESEEKRVCVAFNFFPTGKIGNRLTELEFL